jgi:hypothetical protein
MGADAIAHYFGVTPEVLWPNARPEHRELTEKDELAVAVEFDLDRYADHKVLELAVRHALAFLPDRQALLVRYYFGLDCAEKTLPEIATELGISYGRACVLFQRALRQLRYPSRSELVGWWFHQTVMWYLRYPHSNIARFVAGADDPEFVERYRERLRESKRMRQRSEELSAQLG